MPVSDEPIHGSGQKPSSLFLRFLSRSCEFQKPLKLPTLPRVLYNVLNDSTPAFNGFAELGGSPVQLAAMILLAGGDSATENDLVAFLHSEGKKVMRCFAGF